MLTSSIASRIEIIGTILAMCLWPIAEATVPQSSEVLVWEPHGHFLVSLEPELRQRVEAIKSYDIKIFQEKGFDDSPDKCTVREMKDQLTSGKGIIYYNAHGSPNPVAEVYQTLQACADAMAGYLAEGNDFKLYQYGQWVDGLEMCSGQQEDGTIIYGIAVKSALTTAWCKQFSNTRQGLAFTQACTAGIIGYNAFNVEVNFGYTVSTSTAATRPDLEGIFDRMVAGVWNGSPTVTAGNAYSNYNDSSVPILTKWGSGSTGLYPYAVAYYPIEEQQNVGTLVGDHVQTVAMVQFMNTVRIAGSDATGAVSLQGATFTGSPGAYWTPISPDPNGGLGYMANTLVFYLDAAPNTWVTVRISGELCAAIKSGDIYLNGEFGDGGNQDDYVYRFKTRNSP